MARFSGWIRSAWGRFRPTLSLLSSHTLPLHPYIGNEWLTEWTSTIQSVVASDAGNKQCYYRCYFGCTHFTDYTLPEQNTLFTVYPECIGYNHFNVIDIITDIIRLPDILYRVKFIQLLILVDGMNRLADIAWEHSEQVGYLELCHPYGCCRHNDYTRFTDCYYSSVHNVLNWYCLLIVISLFASRLYLPALSMSFKILSSVIRA